MALDINYTLSLREKIDEVLNAEKAKLFQLYLQSVKTWIKNIDQQISIFKLPLEKLNE